MEPVDQRNPLIIAQANHGNWGVIRVTQLLTPSQKGNNTPTQETHMRSCHNIQALLHGIFHWSFIYS